MVWCLEEFHELLCSIMGKGNTKRFPRSLTENGKPLEICTTFSNNLLQADKRAFCELMKHIKAIDSQENTVIMMQVENEIGMLESARDHSPLAEKLTDRQFLPHCSRHSSSRRKVHGQKFRH